MRKAQTPWGGWFDKAFVAWVALALALMLPAVQWQRLAPGEGIDEGHGAASQPLRQHGEEDHSASPCEEPSVESLESLEDEAVVHDKHAFVLVGLRLEISPVVQFEPDSLHTSEPERPPLHTA